MEEAARRETDTVSKSTNELCGKKTCSVLIKGKDGKVLASEREQADSWKSHFQEVLNLAEPDDPATAAVNQPNITTDPPTLEEVGEAIQAISLTEDMEELRDS